MGFLSSQQNALKTYPKIIGVSTVSVMVKFFNWSPMSFLSSFFVLACVVEDGKIYQLGQLFGGRQILMSSQFSINVGRFVRSRSSVAFFGVVNVMTCERV